MAKKDAINLNFDISSIDAVIKEFVELQRATNAPTEKIEKILKDLYKLQDAAKNGTPITVNSLNSITSRLSQFGSQMKDSFSTEYIESLNKKVTELTKNIAENEKEMTKLKKANPQLKGNVTRYSNQKDKLLKDTMGQKLFDDENELKSFARGNVTAERKITEKMTAQEKAEAELYNKKLALAKQYATQYDEIEKKLKNAKQQLRDNEKAQSDVVAEAKKLKDTLEDTIQPDVAEALSKAGQHTSDLSNNLRQVTVDSNATGGSLVTLSNSASISSMSFGKMAKSMTIYKVAIQGIKKLLSSAMQTFKDMDSAITNMAVVTGRSREELWGMTSDFKDLAQQAGSTMTEMAELTTEFVRQGRAMSDAKTLAVETAKAAKIAGISVSDSLTYMTSAINGFNLSASDASRVSDVFAKVAAVSATDYNQLAIALSKVSAQANQAGMSIEYTTALLAKGIETTQEAPESIGTALKTIIARFRELSDYGSTLEDGMNVNKVEAALKAVGIELRNESGEFRDLTDVLNELGPKWDSLNTMQRQAIAQAAAGTRQQSRFLAIMQDWGRTMELVDSAQDSAGASAAQYAKYAEGLTATLTNLKTTWQEFTTKAINEELIVNALQRVNDILSGISDKLDDKQIQGFLGVLGTILVAYKAIDLYDKFRLLRSQKIAKIMSGQSYEQELQLARAKMTTEEFQKFAKERAQAYQDQIKQKIIQIETTYKQRKAEAENLAILQKEALETERINRLKAGENAKTVNTNIDNRLQQVDAELKEQLSKIDDARKADLQAYQDYSEEITKLSQAASNSIGIGGSKITSLLSNIRSIIPQVTKGFKDARASGQSLWKSIKTGSKSAVKSLKAVGKAAAIAMAAALIIQTVQEISVAVKELQKTSKDYLSDINTIYGEIGSLYENNSSLNTAIEEYSLLENKIHKTAAEQDRLNELTRAFAAGDYGDDITDISSARQKYAQNDLEIESKYDEILSKAMQSAAKEGADILDNSDFITSLKEIAKRKITIQVVDSRTRAAKETTQAAMENFDFSEAYKNLNASEIKKNVKYTAGMDAGEAAGIILAHTGTGAAAGAFGGAGVFSWLGALIGAAAGLTGGIIHVIAKQTPKFHQQVAAATAVQMEFLIAQTTQEVQKFALDYAEVADESLSTQFQKYQELMESDAYTSLAKELIGKAESGFKILDDLDFDKAQIDKLKGKFNTITDTAFKTFIDLAANYGDEGARAFYQVWEELIDVYEGDALKASADLYKVINGVETDAAIAAKFDADKYSKAAVEAAYEVATEAENRYNEFVENGTNLSNKEKRALASEFGITTKIDDADFLKEVGAALKSEYDIASSEAQNLEQNFRAISDACLDMISSFATFNELSQGLTGLRSVFENIGNFREELENGTISLENLNTVATEYADVFGSQAATAAIESGDYQKIADLLGGVSTVSDMISNQHEMINDFVERQKAELKVAIAELDKNDEDYEEQVKALEENTQAQINAAELYAQMYFQISETQQIDRDRKYAARAYERGIEQGNLNAYAQRSATSKDILTDYKKDYEDFKYDEKNNLSVMAGNISTNFATIYDKILEGDWDLYNALSDIDKESFYAYLSTLDKKEQAYYDYTVEVEGYDKEYQDKIIESQEEALEIYKNNLKKETEELKEQIDKRKEYYEDFFDLLEQEEETEDYEAERQRLLNTISALSTSNDAASLAKLKDAQAALNDLEKEQRASEREQRQENTMNMLDDLSEQVDEDYEKAIENNAAIWKMFQEQGSETMINMLRTMARAEAGYNNMTDAQKAQWDRDFATKAANWGLTPETPAEETEPEVVPPNLDDNLGSQGQQDQDKTVQKTSPTGTNGGSTTANNINTVNNTTNNNNNITINQEFPNIRNTGDYTQDTKDIFRTTISYFGDTLNSKV